MYVVPSENGIESSDNSSVKASVEFTDSSAKLILSLASKEDRTEAESSNNSTATASAVHVLELPHLYDPIQGATAKVLKSGKVVLTLNKKDDAHFTWHDLRKVK